MKRFLLTIFCLCMFAMAKAQALSKPEAIKISDISPKVDTSEKAPTFVGGEMQLMKFIKKNQRTLSDSDTHGRVTVSFVIEKDGSVNEVKVIKGLTSEADEEAIRLIKKMPKWTPGIQNNTPVRVRFSMPIAF